MMKKIPAAIGLVGVLWFLRQKSSSNGKEGKDNLVVVLKAVITMMKKIPAAIGLDGSLWFLRQKSSSNGKEGKGIRPLSIATGNDTLDTVTTARIERDKNGPWEVECSFGGEADLLKHFKSCVKNPGHVNFIPVDQFNVEHLPPGYQDNDLVELVKAQSDLTVRVSVHYVSERRPETVPGSNKPYPYYNNGGRRDITMLGSGWVRKMNIIAEGKNCECKECLSSKEPKTVFAHIVIVTAAHVVYDELEGAHTTCHFFFDRGGTPDKCSGVRTLSGATRAWSKPESDVCNMTYVTHDLDIIDKIDNTLFCVNSLKEKIFKKIFTGVYPGPPVSRARALESVPTIIVSHPHGCSKQVSVGYTNQAGFTDPKNWSDFAENLLYTTATCPGSSGAPVRMYDNVYLLAFPHAGTSEDNEINFSVAGALYDKNVLDRV